MTDISMRSRQSKGTSSGGQFATEARADSPVAGALRGALDPDPAFDGAREAMNSWRGTDEPDSHLMDDIASAGETLASALDARGVDTTELDAVLSYWHDLDEHDLDAALDVANAIDDALREHAPAGRLLEAHEVPTFEPRFRDGLALAGSAPVSAVFSDPETDRRLFAVYRTGKSDEIVGVIEQPNGEVHTDWMPADALDERWEPQPVPDGLTVVDVQTGMYVGGPHEEWIDQAG